MTHPLRIERQPEEKRDQVTVENKWCSACTELKPWYEFGLNKAHHTGLSAKCLDCERQYQREWREKQARGEVDPESPQKRAARVRSENLRIKKDMALAQARTQMAVPPSPPPMPVEVSSLIAMMNGSTNGDISETRARFELAARIIENQQEILRLLLGGRND